MTSLSLSCNREKKHTGPGLRFGGSLQFWFRPLLEKIKQSGGFDGIEVGVSARLTERGDQTSIIPGRHHHPTHTQHGRRTLLCPVEKFRHIVRFSRGEDLNVLCRKAISTIYRPCVCVFLVPVELDGR
jgi:hypothetical protein